MAKDKTKKPIGRAVTFIFLIALIVGVILAIVLISIYTPKSTKALAQDLNEVVTDGYLNESDEDIAAISSYLSDVKNLEGSVTTIGENDFVKIGNFSNAIKSYRIMGEFFNNEIVYTTYTSVYGSNANSIMKNFKNAQAAVDELVEYLDENLTTIGDSETALALSWKDAEVQVDTILTCTASAMSGLMEVYESCVESKVMNNDLSSLVFAFCETYISRISLDVTDEGVTTELVESAGENLLLIAKAYLQGENVSRIIGYSYNTASTVKNTDKTLKEVVEDLTENGEGSGYFSAFKSGLDLEEA